MTARQNRPLQFSIRLEVHIVTALFVRTSTRLEARPKTPSAALQPTRQNPSCGVRRRRLKTGCAWSKKQPIESVFQGAEGPYQPLVRLNVVRYTFFAAADRSLIAIACSSSTPTCFHLSYLTINGSRINNQAGADYFSLN